MTQHVAFWSTERSEPRETARRGLSLSLSLSREKECFPKKKKEKSRSLSCRLPQVARQVLRITPFDTKQIRMVAVLSGVLELRPADLGSRFLDLAVDGFASRGEWLDAMQVRTPHQRVLFFY